MNVKENLLNFAISKLKGFGEITLSEAYTTILKSEAADHKKELKDVGKRIYYM